MKLSEQVVFFNFNDFVFADVLINTVFCALSDVLQIFKGNKINLTWIESFPYRDAKGEYVFFVDFKGHREDPKIKKALALLEDICDTLSVLGSFPLAKLTD